MGSILDTLKSALGYSDDYNVYDPELIIYTNTALSDLTQLGIGPKEGYAIETKAQTWEDFIGGPMDPRLGQAPSYVYFTVRLIHDPPSLSSVQDAFERLKLEASWRLTVAMNEINKEKADAEAAEEI